MKKVKIFFINAILLTVSSIILSFIGVYFSIYISKRITPEALGLHQIIVSVYMFFVTIATSGINLATTRIVTEETSIKNVQGSKIAMRQCIKYSLILGIISTCLLILLSQFICDIFFHKKISKIVIYIISISLPFVSVSSATRGYFIAKRKAYKSVISSTIEQCAMIVIAIYLLNIFKNCNTELGCTILVLSTAIGDIISCIYSFISYKREDKIQERVTKNYLRKILHIAVPVALTSYIKSFLSTIKQVIVPIRLEASGMSCEESLSKYGIIGGKVMPILMFPGIIIQSCCGLLIPEVSSLNIKKSFKTIENIVEKIFKMTSIFSFCVIGILFFYSKELSSIIYGQVEISQFIQILCPITILIYLDNIIDSILKAIDKQINVVLVNILDIFISIILIYNLLPIYGIYGYLLVILISETMNIIISLIELRKEIKFNINIINCICKPIICIVIAYITVNLIKIFIIKIIMFILIYILYLILLKGIELKKII